MKVILLENRSSDGDVVFQLLAKGGYAFLPLEEQNSGRVSADVVWESGFGTYTSDQIYQILYDESSDIFIEIAPFYRKIEGSTIETGLSPLFNIIKLIFTSPKFQEDELKKALVKVKEASLQPPLDQEESINEKALLLNTRNYPPFLPLTNDSFKKIDVSVIKTFFQQSFQSPKEFVCVIVGDLDIKKAKKDILSLWDESPEQEEAPLFKKSLVLPSFPDQSIVKIIDSKQRADSLTRLSFPIKEEITQENIRDLDFLVHLLEEHLRQDMKKLTLKTHGIDVSYEFPFYPFLKGAWLTIQFHSDYHSTDTLTKHVFSSLSHLNEYKVNKASITNAEIQVERLEEYWKKENSYWLSKLINTSIFDWNPDSLEDDSKYSPSEIKSLLKDFFDFNIYTRITTKPK